MFKILCLIICLLTLSAHAFWFETKVGQNMAQWQSSSLSGPGVELKLGPEVLNPIAFGPQIFYGINTIDDERLGFKSSVHHFSAGPHVTFNGVRFRAWVSMTLTERFSTTEAVKSRGQDIGKVKYQGTGFKTGLGVNLAKNYGVNLEVQRKNINKITDSFGRSYPELAFKVYNFFLSLSILY